jgi:hypothetical protein
MVGWHDPCSPAVQEGEMKRMNKNAGSAEDRARAERPVVIDTRRSPRIGPDPELDAATEKLVRPRKTKR